MPIEPPVGEMIAVLMPIDLAVHVEQRAAGIAAVDRGVGLDEVVVGPGIDVAVARRDDAERHRAAEAERDCRSPSPSRRRGARRSRRT